MAATAPITTGAPLAPTEEEPNRWKEIAPDAVKAGDVMLFGRDGSATDEVILFLSNTYVAHAGMCVGQNVFSDATGKGVRYKWFQLGTSEGDRFVYVRRPKDISDELAGKLVLAADSLQGQPYDYNALFIVAVVSMLERLLPQDGDCISNLVMYAVRKVAEKLINRTHDDDSKTPMVCSQFVVNCFTDAGHPLSFDKPKPDSSTTFLQRVLKLLKMLPEILKAIWEIEHPTDTAIKPAKNDSNVDDLAQALMDAFEGKNLRTRDESHNDAEIFEIFEIISCCTTLVEKVIAAGAVQNVSLATEKRVQQLVAGAGSQHKDAVFVSPGDLLSLCEDPVHGFEDVGKFRVTYHLIEDTANPGQQAV